MMYQAILFDADGMTIISKRFSEQIQKDYGIVWEKMAPFFSGPFQQCKLGKADLKEELAKVIAEWGWTGTVDELIAYWFRAGSELQPEIVALVKELRALGVKCYLSTNQEKYRADFLRHQLGLGEIFDDLLVSCDLGYMKDNPAFFESAYLRITKDESISHEQILFVDHEEKNLLAAQSVGFVTYSYTDVQSFRKEVML